MRPPTARQREALEAIHRLTKPRGPTVRELGAALGLRSSCSVQRHIEALQGRGLVTRPRTHGEARGVIVTDRGRLELEKPEHVGGFPSREEPKAQRFTREEA